MSRKGIDIEDMVTGPRICLVPECLNSRRTRGLCHTHYQKAQTMLRAGLASEADLVRRGLKTRHNQQGGSPTIPFDGFAKGSTVKGKGRGAK